MAVATADVFNGTPGEPIYAGRFAPPPVGVPNTLALSLPSGSATGYPLQFGRAFAQGEITGQIQVSLDGTPLAEQQSDVKTRHPDNSVRFAVISVIVPTLSTTERQLTITSGATVHSNAPESRANMLANYDFDATIRISKSGTPLLGSPLSARSILTSLTDSALASETAAFGINSRYWTQGPVCTTLLLRNHTAKTYDMGSTADRVLRPEFAIEFWPSIGRYRVRFIVSAGDTQKYGGETGLLVEFETGDASKTVHLSETTAVGIAAGTKESRKFWNGASQVTQCNLVHNEVYLHSAGVIPRYNPNHAIAPAALNGYTTDWNGKAKTLGATGYWRKGMGDTGGHPQIAPTPKWDVIALRSGSSLMHDVMVKNAEFYFKFGFYQREGDAARNLIGSSPAIGRCMSKVARPTLFQNDRNSGGGADGYTIAGVGLGNKDGWGEEDAHTPGAFWYPYLLTGEHAWLEGLQQQAAWGFHMVNPGTVYNNLGNGGSSTDTIAHGRQMRSIAWQHRNRARSWWACEDGSPEKALFLKSLDDTCAQRFGLFDMPYMLGNPIREGWRTNVAGYYSLISGGGLPNPLGVWTYNRDEYPAQPGNVAGGGSMFPLWQQGFISLAFFEAAKLGHAFSLPLGAVAVRQLVDYANSPQPRHISTYTHPYAKSDNSWWSSITEILAAWNDEATTTDGAMGPSSAVGHGGGGAPGTPGVVVEGRGIIHTAAIAMAKDAGVAGADTAWAVLKPWVDNTVYTVEDPRFDIYPAEA